MMPSAIIRRTISKPLLAAVEAVTRSSLEDVPRRRRRMHYSGHRPCHIGASTQATKHEPYEAPSTLRRKADAVHRYHENCVLKGLC